MAANTGSSLEILVLLVKYLSMLQILVFIWQILVFRWKYVRSWCKSWLAFVHTWLLEQILVLFGNMSLVQIRFLMQILELLKQNLEVHWKYMLLLGKYVFACANTCFPFEYLLFLCKIIVSWSNNCFSVGNNDFVWHTCFCVQIHVS